MDTQENATRLNQLWNNSRMPQLVLWAMAGLLLIYWAGDRLWAYLPYGLFLLCPLMHLFMHRGGHGGHGGNTGHGGHGCCPAPAHNEQDQGQDRHNHD